MFNDVTTPAKAYPVWQYRENERPAWRMLCGTTAELVYGAQLSVITTDMLCAAAEAVKVPASVVLAMRPSQRNDLARLLWMSGHGGVWVDDTVILMQRLDVLHGALEECDSAFFAAHFAHPDWLPDICASVPDGRVMVTARRRALRNPAPPQDMPYIFGRRVFSEMCPRMTRTTHIMKLHSYFVWTCPGNQAAYYNDVFSAPGSAAPEPRADLWAVMLGVFDHGMMNGLLMADIRREYPVMAALFKRGGVL